VALYFFTFGAPAASAICGVKDASITAAAGIIIVRIFIGIRIQIFSLGNTLKIQLIKGHKIVSTAIYPLLTSIFLNPPIASTQ
jgi:hypothetical protein